MAACLPRRALAAAGVMVRRTGTTMITSAPAPTATAAGHASPRSVPSEPVPASSRASAAPASPPATAAIVHSGMASATVSPASCRRVAPRAASIADSPSRWSASSRAITSRAAQPSRNTSTAQMASSERATARLSAVPLSTDGRLVTTVRSGSVSELDSACRRPDTLAAMALRLRPAMLAVAGSASHEPVLTVSGPVKAAACTVTGPYVVNPPEVVEPESPISSSCQYSDDAPEAGPGRYRPVTRNRSTWPDAGSRIRSRSPPVTWSIAAVVAGSAAGMGCPAAGGPGQVPETSTACAWMPLSAAASATGVLSVPAGRAGSEPATNASGSDQSAR